MATEMRIDAAGLEAEVLADVERLQAWDLASQVAGLQVSVRAPRLCMRGAGSLCMRGRAAVMGSPTLQTLQAPILP
jgi:hypothetical protein